MHGTCAFILTADPTLPTLPAGDGCGDMGEGVPLAPLPHDAPCPLPVGWALLPAAVPWLL